MKGSYIRQLISKHRKTMSASRKSYVHIFTRHLKSSWNSYFSIMNSRTSPVRLKQQSRLLCQPHQQKVEHIETLNSIYMKKEEKILYLLEAKMPRPCSVSCKSWRDGMSTSIELRQPTNWAARKFKTLTVPGRINAANSI